MHNYFSRLFLNLKNKSKKTSSFSRFIFLRRSSLNNSVFNLKHRSNIYIYIYNSIVGLSFLILTFLTVSLFAPQVKTNAETQSNNQVIGPYTMSMATEETVAVEITPTATQKVYEKTSNVTAKNTCEAGARITMNMSSATTNALTRAAVDGDLLTKEIAATTTNALDDNSWGYSLNNSATYAAVPKAGVTPAVVYDASTAQVANLTIPVKFGVKANDQIPSGTYVNEVVYTMTPKAGCLGYGINWNLNGGVAKAGATYVTTKNWGETINLNELTPTKDGYTFVGWNDGTTTYTAGTVNVNSSNSKTVNLKAVWNLISYTKDFDYTGNEQNLVVPYTGYYKLEVWGAQGGGGEVVSGGGYTKTAGRGGYGAYSVGVVNLNKDARVYVNVGGQGSMCKLTGRACAGSGGYNGGGYAWSDTLANGGQETSGGGGATHIATTSGLLFNLASGKQSILIVAAGGGGGGEVSRVSNIARGEGGDGGGVVGIHGNDYSPGSPHLQGRGAAYSGKGASFSAGGGNEKNVGVGYFGHGGEYSSRIDCCGNSGGGGGWYGGGASLRGHGGGGGGSSYIGATSLVSGAGVVKHMTCFECTTSSDNNTRTNSNSNVSETATADYAKKGNGYAKITYLGTSL